MIRIYYIVYLIHLSCQGFLIPQLFILTTLLCDSSVFNFLFKSSRIPCGVLTLFSCLAFFVVSVEVLRNNYQFQNFFIFCLIYSLLLSWLGLLMMTDNARNRSVQSCHLDCYVYKVEFIILYLCFVFLVKEFLSLSCLFLCDHLVLNSYLNPVEYHVVS